MSKNICIQRQCRATKIIALLVFGLLDPGPGFAQLDKKIKEKTETRTEGAVDRTIDKGFNKLDQGIDKLFSGKRSRNTSKDQSSGNDYQEHNQNKYNDNTGKNNQEERNSGYGESPLPALQRYSQFTFIPGEELIAFEDFSLDRVGDLPGSWISTGTAEVIKFEGQTGSWLWFNKTQGNFVPGYLRDFPDNFTLEFDMMFDFRFGTYSHNRELMIVFSDIANPESKLNWEGRPSYFFLQKLAPNYTGIAFSGTGSGGGPFITGRKAVSNNSGLNFTNSFQAKDIIHTGKINTPVHIAISRNGRRMQVFANEVKVLDLTNAFEKDVKLTSARFYINNSTETDNYYITNIRYAKGQPDVRNKILSSGSYTTTAITFPTGSATIKPESYAILKEIATALHSQPAKSLTITGHTDSDGNAQSNQSLSEQRADAVKLALMKEFGVSNSISTQGKGASSPVADNTSASGKAQNRRVGFHLK